MHVFCIPVSDTEGQQLTRVSCLGQAINFKVAGYDPSPLYKQSVTLTQWHMYVINETTSTLSVHIIVLWSVQPVQKLCDFVVSQNLGLYSDVSMWYISRFPLYPGLLLSVPNSFQRSRAPL